MFEEINCKKHFEELVKVKGYRWLKKEFKKQKRWKNSYPVQTCEVKKKGKKKCGKPRYACVLLKFGCDKRPIYAVGVTS